MPFGDHIEAYVAGVSREGFGPRRLLTGRPVEVPEVDAPWWWTEYLTEVCKRKNRLDQPVRRLLHGLVADERYHRECRLADSLYPQLYPLHQRQPPLHPIWDAVDG